MSQKTKKQHYVPQCYLNAWSIPNTHQVHVYDKKLDTFRINNIQDVASERYFYDVDPHDIFTEETIYEFQNHGIVFNSKGKSQGLEHAFAEEVEKPFSIILHQLIESASSATPWHINNCYFISEDKKSEFSVYLTLQYIRTKSIRSGILESADCLGQVLADMGAPFSTIDKYSVSKQDAKNAHIKMLFDIKSLYEITATFNTLTWMLGINKTAKKLYTTDNPIGTKAHIKDPILSMNGIASKGVEVFYPLSPDVILIMVDGSYHTRLQPLDRRFIEITDSANIDFYNSILAMRASRSVFSSDVNMFLIDEMKKDDPNIFKQPHTQLNWGNKTYYPKKGEQYYV